MSSNNPSLQEALRSLNNIQREAVLSNAKSLQIVAGPGSGKTKVLVCRVAYLIIERKILPTDILLVTFTKKAANELKERLRAVIGNHLTHLIQIGTFHSICSSILRLNARKVNMEPNFKIIDEKIRRNIIQEIMADETLPIKYAAKQLKIEQILKEIDNAKERGENHIKFQNIYSSSTSQLKAFISIFYQAYEERLKEGNLMDFGGLILKTSELLREKVNSICAIDCVLIDEFQDTSSSQYELLKLIMAQSPHKTITAVGDPDQSIYGWRSAKNKVFQEMQDDFQDTDTINLEQNYRSTGRIVESAAHVIMQDTERMNKALYTNNPIGIPMSLISTNDERKQAEFVAFEIAKIVDNSKGLIQYRDIAILMRANFIFHQFERILRLHQIPFNLKGGDRFFNRMEIKDMLAYLKFTFNPHDIDSFERIINIPNRHVRPITIDTILEISKAHELTVLESIDIFLNGQRKFVCADRKELLKFVDLCQTIQQKIEIKVAISDIIKFIYEEVNYYTHLRKHYYKDHVGRIKNVNELVNMATRRSGIYEEYDNSSCNEEEKEKSNMTIVIPIENMIIDSVKKEELDMESEQAKLNEEAVPERNQEVEKFLNYCDSCFNQKQQTEKKGGMVTLSTIHASKGLEWPCVFVVSCIDGVIPATDDSNEEKRILYVAMTRSKFFLYCIAPEFVGDWGSYKRVLRSPYLKNLNANLFSSTPPKWTEELLNMLSDTIRLKVPDNNDSLKNSKIPKSTSSQPVHKTTSNNIPKAAFTFYQPYSSSVSPKTKITVAPTFTYSSNQYNSSSAPVGQKRSFHAEDDSENWLNETVKEEPTYYGDNFNF